MTPAQKFRQYDLQYPRNAASNCFAFIGGSDGLYFGSHDTSLQQTWHGLRAYPDAAPTDKRDGNSENGSNGSSGSVTAQLVHEGSPIGHTTEDFTELEAGFYRYPNAMCGDSWSNDASVVIPYSGDWTATSRIYRRWADTWWHHAEVPQWVRNMTGWQRIIFKHQYGEYLRKFTDLPGRIAEAGESVGCNAVLAFGWWKVEESCDGKASEGRSYDARRLLLSRALGRGAVGRARGCGFPEHAGAARVVTAVSVIEEARKSPLILPALHP